MTKKEIKNCLEYRLQRLKELTGENYSLDWYHGIVALQVIDEGHVPHHGKFGDANNRRTASEMLAYLDGLLSGLTGIKY